MLPNGTLRNVILMTLACVAGAAIGELMINHGVIRFAALAGGLIGGIIGGYLLTVFRAKMRRPDHNPTSNCNSAECPLLAQNRHRLMTAFGS